ncbi:MAG: tRNA 2-thiocytidine biosynthesis TtcA family protein [Spirochaetaceae bacterium]|jgi:tRNA 2-thiocytidine biosynthesis protein TtcA|nr:tRNA 2-thiocytidine biosynthesis TtcA family protein [Spirochaetaceae bacterium]
MSERLCRKRGASVVAQKLVARAVFDHNLICSGDRILIAVSGGKDSTVLAMMLSLLRPALKVEYQLAGLHISTDFCSCCKRQELIKRLESWGIPFEDVFVPVVGRLKAGRKMNCYWCSTQRRAELIAYALSHNFNKIALGHHLDDNIETYFMNITAAGKLCGMPALLRYNKYPLALIRPLSYLEERQVVACADETGLLQSACTCPYGRNSQRVSVRKKIADLCGGSGAVKRRMVKAFDEEALCRMKLN